VHRNRSYHEGILLGRKLLIKVKILGTLSALLRPLVHPIIPELKNLLSHVPSPPATRSRPFGRTLLIGSHWAPGLRRSSERPVAKCVVAWTGGSSVTDVPVLLK